VILLDINKDLAQYLLLINQHNTMYHAKCT